MKKVKISLLYNALSNIDTHEEIPIMAEKNYSSEEVESDIQSKSSNTPIPIVFENCEGTKDSNLMTIVTNIEKPDIFFLLLYEYRTYKYNKKLRSPGALNIKETPGYKQKENVKKIMITKNKSKPKN